MSKSQLKTLSSPKNALRAVLALSVVGWINALYILWHRQGLIAHGALERSFCNINATFNCDAIALSKYSTLLGVPNAALGMVFYALLTVGAIWTYFLLQDGEDEKAAKASGLVQLTAFVALFPTVGLGMLSSFELHTYCLMCLFSYLINILLYTVAHLARKSCLENSKEKPALFAGLSVISSPLMIVSAIVVGLNLLAPALVNSAVGGDGSTLDDNTINLVLQSHQTSPAKTLSTENAPSYGAIDPKSPAKVTIVEFSDMQCPYCAISAKTLPSIIRNYEKDVRVVYKNYPLDRSCNASMQNEGHRLSCLAAKSGWCVFVKKGNDAFFEYKITVFENQPKLTPEMIKEFAVTKGGVSKEELESCLADPQTHQAIVDQVSEGNAVGVNATPTLFVNGRKLETGANPKILKALLDQLTAK